MADNVIPPKPLEKVQVAPVFDDQNRQTVASMKYGRVDPTYLTTLMMEHKANVAKYGKGYPVGNELASVIKIVIKKTAGLPMWHQYTDNWKEDMIGRALVQALQYVHNFDPVKMAKDSKNNDPYYYIAMIVTRAFMQQIKENKKKASYIKFTSLNENILHSVTSLDQYAGVLAKNNAEEMGAMMGSVGCEGSINEGIDTMERLGF